MTDTVETPVVDVEAVVAEEGPERDLQAEWQTIKEALKARAERLIAARGDEAVPPPVETIIRWVEGLNDDDMDAFMYIVFELRQEITGAVFESIITSQMLMAEQSSDQTIN